MVVLGHLKEFVRSSKGTEELLFRELNGEVLREIKLSTFI
jgi:hypothetical protein